MPEEYVAIFALGGLGEIGKNMYCVRFRNEIVVIDAGLKFPEEDMPGVDKLIPDITYLQKKRSFVKGIFLTHGHEDHIGALPHVLKNLNVPIYGGPLTIGLVRAKLEEFGMHNSARLHTVTDQDVIQLENLSVSFFKTNHSIPDSMAIVVHTPEGSVVHTGDFKFDFTPMDQRVDFSIMANIGQKGVLALLSDSTNSEKPGYTPSEKKVGEAIKDQFEQCPGRILFATFASNVHRLQQVVEAAWRCGRKLAFVGRSMEKVTRIGEELGHIRFPDRDMLIDVKDVGRYRDDQVVVVCTGSQGEKMAALTRIAFGSHRSLSVHPGDTVIFSSSPIPGNTKQVYRSIDQLFRAGANVIYSSIFDIHTSGHGNQEDMKLMLRLMQPKYFIPIHGEYRMLVQHARLAERLGIPRKRIRIYDNGQVLLINRKHARSGKKLTSAGTVYVNGNTLSSMKGGILDERIRLSEEGMLIVAATVDMERNIIVSGPDVISRGFIYMREAEDFLEQLTRKSRCLILDRIRANNITPLKLNQAIENALQQVIFQNMKRKPMIIPAVKFLYETRKQQPVQ